MQAWASPAGKQRPIPEPRRTQDTIYNPKLNPKLNLNSNAGKQGRPLVTRRRSESGHATGASGPAVDPASSGGVGADSGEGGAGFHADRQLSKAQRAHAKRLAKLRKEGVSLDRSSVKGATIVSTLVPFTGKRCVCVYACM